MTVLWSSGGKRAIDATKDGERKRVLQITCSESITHDHDDALFFLTFGDSDLEVSSSTKKRSLRKQCTIVVSV
jgi:hypothetical protein